MLVAYHAYHQQPMMVRMRETISSISTQKEGELLTKKGAARFLNVSVKTLDRWIYIHRGPKYFKVGGTLVRYRHSDLVAFMEEGPTGPAAHTGGEAA